VPATALSI